MARIRTIKPGFFRHLELFQAEQESKLPLRVAFAGLWTAADREGRFKWVPEALKLDCLPYDKVDFSRVLDALATRGFVMRYASNGADLGWIPGFNKHQVVNNREAQSDLPPPPENIEESTREARVVDASQSGSRGREGKGTGREQEHTPYSPPGDFETFWAAYPKKRGKGQAEKWWSKHKPDSALLGRILAALEWQKISQDWRKDGGKFIPHPSTYLNQERWLDEQQIDVQPEQTDMEAAGAFFASELQGHRGGPSNGTGTRIALPPSGEQASDEPEPDVSF